MFVQLLSSSDKSWIFPYGEKLKKDLTEMGHKCNYVFSEKDIVKGDILILLSYDKIFKSLNLNNHNLVIHESDLPKGRGMSPLTWQILEGNNVIPVTLIEASKGVDEGDIYDQILLKFTGLELNVELKHKQGLATIEIVKKFIEKYPYNIRKKQIGKPTYYKRRTPLDSELDPQKSIEEQFNLLRVCDNERYPAFFYLKDKKFKILIFEDNE